ncbi:hypothetical protein FACS1894184_19490 [Clostridia bacterium]|nr:hypothetical protein FACS1894184_19490 [Clostridia bacterium]
MPYRQANTSVVILKERAVTASFNPDEDLYKWQDGVQQITARINPLIDHNSHSKEHGETATGKLVMYYDGYIRLKSGQGICVDVLATDSCDYVITGVEHWRMYQQADLEWIPEERRG